VPDAARTTPPDAREAAWFAQLPTVVAAAAALFTNQVSEEIGLDIEPGPLLVIGWMAPGGVRTRPVMHFVFDGGVLADGTPIRLQESELDDYRFVDAGDLDRYLPTFLTARVAAALRGRARGATVYLPWTGS